MNIIIIEFMIQYVKYRNTARTFFKALICMIKKYIYILKFLTLIFVSIMGKNRQMSQCV